MGEILREERNGERFVLNLFEIDGYMRERKGRN